MRFLYTLLFIVLLPVGAACSSGEAGPETAAEEETEDASAEVDVLPPDPLPRADSARAVPLRPAADDNRSLAERLDDASLATRVKKAFLDTSDLRAFDFDVTAQRGQVAIAGSVATARQQALVTDVARGVDGVRGVANRVAAPDAPAPAPEPTVAAADTAGPPPATPPAEKETPPAPEPPQEAVQHHTVRSGESLWTISRQYNTTVEQLRTLNDLDHGSKLQPGQRLRVK